MIHVNLGNSGLKVSGLLARHGIDISLLPRLDNVTFHQGAGGT